MQSIGETVSWIEISCWYLGWNPVLIPCCNPRKESETFRIIKVKIRLKNMKKILIIVGTIH